MFIKCKKKTLKTVKKKRKILLPAFHKTAISRKTKSFRTFWLFFLVRMVFGIINQIIQKDLAKNEVCKF